MVYYILSVSPLSISVCARLFQSCPTLCDPMDCNLPGTSEHGILQARILERVPNPGIEPASLSLFIFCLAITLLLLFFIYFYYLEANTLQYCSGFCHTLTWISHGFTCVPHPDPPSYLPLHPIPLGLPSAPALSTCLMHPTWAGDLFHPG